jgi:hypothetical protein
MPRASAFRRVIVLPGTFIDIVSAQLLRYMDSSNSFNSQAPGPKL